MGLSRKQMLVLGILVLGAFAGTLNQTLVTPAMPFVMDEMDVGADTAQWLTTGFTLVVAIMIPITAHLTDRYSIRRLFLIAMCVFVGGTLLVIWGPLFWIVFVGRLIQAMGTGILMPMVMTVVMLSVPFERRGLSMGLYGFVIGGGPAVGPVIGGLLLGLVTWRIMFLIVAILAVVIVLASLFILPHEEDRNAALHLDKPSVILSTLGFGGLLYGCSCIGSSGLGVIDILSAALGLVALVFFFRRQRNLETPMLQVQVLSNRAFLIGTLLIMVVQVALLTVGLLIPLYVQTLRGFSSTVSGLITLPGAILMGCSGPIAGHLFDRHGPRKLAFVGIALLTVSAFAFAFIDENTSAIYLVAFYAVCLFAISLLNMPMTTWAINALDDKLLNHGISVNMTLRQVAGSIGTALLVSIMTVATSVYATTGEVAHADYFGIRCAFLVGGLICLVGLVLLIRYWVMRRHSM